MAQENKNIEFMHDFITQKYQYILYNATVLEDYFHFMKLKGSHQARTGFDESFPYKFSLGQFFVFV